jgi:hypothetical protein
MNMRTNRHHNDRHHKSFPDFVAFSQMFNANATWNHGAAVDVPTVGPTGVLGGEGEALSPVEACCQIRPRIQRLTVCVAIQVISCIRPQCDALYLDALIRTAILV